MRRVCASALLLSLLAIGCATERTVQWGDETPTEQTEAPKADAAAPLTAEQYAEGFPTEDGCEAEARKIHERRPELAIRLLKACVTRGDFKRLSALTDAPWTASLASDREASALAARVVAARSGDLEADVRACAKAGYPITTLADLYEAPEKAKGKRVVFRGRLDTDVVEKGRVRLVETGLEPGEIDTQPTGRRISATFAGGLKAPGRDGVFLARAQKVGEDTVVNDGESVATVEVTSVFTPASASTF